LQELWKRYAALSPVQFDEKLHADACGPQQPPLVINDSCLGVRPGAITALEERWCQGYGDIGAPKCSFTGFTNLLLAAARTNREDIGGGQASDAVSDAQSPIRQACRRYLLAGRPGCGKTTFCKTLLRGWAAGGLLSSGFDIVLYLPLAEMDATLLQTATTPLQLLHSMHTRQLHQQQHQRRAEKGKWWAATASLTEAELRVAIESAGRRCLIIVDGLDTLVAARNGAGGRRGSGSSGGDSCSQTSIANLLLSLPRWIRVLLGQPADGANGETNAAWTACSCLLTCGTPLLPPLLSLMDCVDATMEILSATAADFSRERTVMSRKYSRVWPNDSLTLVTSSPLLAGLLRRVRRESLLQQPFSDDLRELMDCLVEKMLALYPDLLASLPGETRQAAFLVLGQIAWEGLRTGQATFSFDSLTMNSPSPSVVAALAASVFVRPLQPSNLPSMSETGAVQSDSFQAEPLDGNGSRAGTTAGAAALPGTAAAMLKFLHPLFAGYFCSVFLGSLEELPAGLCLGTEYETVWRLCNSDQLLPRFEAILHDMAYNHQLSSTATQHMARIYWRFGDNDRLTTCVQRLGLRRLDLSFCSIGPVEALGVRRILQASAATLTHLDLGSNPLTGKGVARLFVPPFALPCLETLNVANVGAGKIYCLHPPHHFLCACLQVGSTSLSLTCNSNATDAVVTLALS